MGAICIMLTAILSLVGVCRHRNTSRVWTTPGTKRSWVNCFDCGAEIPYDWTKIQPPKDRPLVAQPIKEH